MLDGTEFLSSDDQKSFTGSCDAKEFPFGFCQIKR